MDGWRVEQRSACVSGDLLVYINEDPLGQNERYTILLDKIPSRVQTPKHKHMSLHTAAGQTAVSHIWRGQTPTCQCPTVLCLHSSRESASAKRHINPLVLQMKSDEPAKTDIWLRFLSVLASSSSVSVSRRKCQPLWSDTRKNRRISTPSCTQ